MKQTWNVTLKLDDSEVLNFENFLNQYLDVISFKILPETSKMYEEDDTFKKLVKHVKKAQRERDIYINNNNSKYKLNK